MKLDNSIRYALVTGANGLLGRSFLEAWADRLKIFAVVRNIPAFPVKGVDYIPMDLAAPLDFEQLPTSIDAVLHLAQSSQMRGFPDAAADIYAVNTASTAQLLDWAVKAGARHFVFASTGGLYEPSREPLSEGSKIAPPRGPLGFYFDTKLCSEVLVRAYQEQMHTVIVRPFFIFGPDQSENMLIPRLINSVRTGHPITVVGADGTRMNPIYVRDAVHALETCLTKGAPRVINVAGPEVLTVGEIARFIGELSDQVPIFEHKEGAASFIVADISLLSKRINTPYVGFRERLIEMQKIDRG